MTLHLCEIPIIEIARILKFIVFEYDDPTALITYSQIISSLIKAYCCQYIIIGYILFFAFSQTINVNPVITARHAIRISTHLARRLHLKVFRRHHHLVLLHFFVLLLRDRRDFCCLFALYCGLHYLFISVIR